MQETKEEMKKEFRSGSRQRFKCLLDGAQCSGVREVRRRVRRGESADERDEAVYDRGDQRGTARVSRQHLEHHAHLVAHRSIHYRCTHFLFLQYMLLTMFAD